MKVKDMLKSKGDVVFSLEACGTVADAAKIMNDKKIGALMIRKEEKYVGIVTERDILKRLYDDKNDFRGICIKELMTSFDILITANPEEELEDIMDKMTTNKIRHIPILVKGEVKGIISIGDVVKALLFVAKAEKKILQDYISSAY